MTTRWRHLSLSFALTAVVAACSPEVTRSTIAPDTGRSAADARDDTAAGDAAAPEDTAPLQDSAPVDTGQPPEDAGDDTPADTGADTGETGGIDAECGPNQHRQGEACVCDEGFMANTAGECVRCLGNDDCGLEVCIGGECRACVSGPECGGDLFCVDGLCSDVEPGCDTEGSRRCEYHNVEYCTSGIWVPEASECPAGCDDLTGECLPTNVVLHVGVASGEVTDSAAIVWARTTGPYSVTIEYGTDPDRLDHSAASATVADTGFTVQVDLAGLEPSTDYTYRVYPEGAARSRLGHFRTAPRPGAAEPVRFMLSGDVDRYPDRWGIFDHMRAQAPEFYLHLGDWPYADSANTLSEYRALHFADRDDLRIEQFLESTSIYPLFDDHEVYNDWDATYAASNPIGVANGLQVWTEWFPFREQVPGQYYRRFQWGQLELFALDDRTLRDPRNDPDVLNASGLPAKSMLSEAQRDWLLDGLRSSTAVFKLILTSVPFDFTTTGSDAWRGYERELELILDTITDEGIDGVIVLTADQHWFSANHHNHGLKEFQVGPISASLRAPPSPMPLHSVSVVQDYNFGLVTYDPVDGGSLLFEAYDHDNALIYSEVVLPGRGRIEVDANIGAKFVICPLALLGPDCAHLFDGLTPRTIEYAVPGTYTIDWLGPIGGFAAPPNQTLELVDGGTIRFDGVYVGEPIELPWYEPFDDENGWLVHDEGGIDAPSDWHLVGGAFAQSSNIYDTFSDGPDPVEKLGTIAFNGDLGWDDYSASVVFNAGDDDGVGLLARFNGPDDYYRFAIDEQRGFARLVARVGGEFEVLDEDLSFPGYTLGRWTQLALSVDGNAIRGFVDGELVVEAVDGRLPTGSVALYSWGSVGLLFDAFAVTDLDAPQFPYFDPLDEDRGWIIVDQGTTEAPSNWYFSGGQFHQDANIYDSNTGVDGPVAKVGTLAMGGDRGWTDYEVSVTMRADDDDGMGVLARVRDSNNYYRFSVDEQRMFARLVRCSGGAFTTLDQVTSFVFDAGEWTTLTLRVDGSTIQAFIDDDPTPLLEAVDSTFASGGIGLYSWGMAGLQFDELVIDEP